MHSRRLLPSFFCVLCCLILPFSAMAEEKRLETYPPQVHVEVPPTVGDGTAFLCTVKASGLRSVSVTFLKHSITVPADADGVAVMLLPVPLDHPDMDAPLAWKAAFTSPEGAYGMPASGTVAVRIRKRAYPVQKLTVAPKYVTPDPELKERIDRERKLMGAALNARSDTRHWTLPMARPVPGKITSLYGLRRVFNGQPRNPHKGLDFRAGAGDPIAAIADGMVVLTGDFYYAGKFVVLDHGLGVVSISMHMSEIAAEQGQAVKRGDRIGLVGSTGRSTGPHLHLGISVLGQSIDALPLIDQTKEDRAAYESAIRDASTVKTQKAAPKGAKKSGQPGKKGTGKKSSGKTAAKSAQPGAGGKQPARKTQ